MFGYLFVAFLVGVITGVCIMGVVASSRINEVYEETKQKYENALKGLIGIYLVTDNDKELIGICEDEELAHTFCREWGPKLKSPACLLVDDVPRVITWEDMTLPYSMYGSLSAFIDTENEVKENEE